MRIAVICQVFSIAPLTFFGDSILRAGSDSSRQAHHLQFKQQLDSLLSQPQSFEYSFDRVKNLSVLTSDDKKLRIYSWMLPTKNGMSFDFFGYVQVMKDGSLLMSDDVAGAIYRISYKQK